MTSLNCPAPLNMKRKSILVVVGVALLASGYVGFPVLFKRIDAYVEHRAMLRKLGDMPKFEKCIWGPLPGKPKEEVYRTVRVKPEIKIINDDGRVVFPPIDGEPVDLFYSPKYEPLWFTNMPKDRELEFTFWLTKEVTRHYESGKEDFFWYPEIETIKDGSNVLYDARICPLHKTTMERGEIEISYGLPVVDFNEAMDKEFYGGPGFTLGGCCVGPEKKTVGYRCADCIAAYKKWCVEFEARIAARKRSLSEQETQAQKAACDETKPAEGRKL